MLQGIVKSVFSNLTLFYESLQALVEGRRDVLQNENFHFDDGKTVKQKQEIFEKYLSKIMGKPQEEQSEILS